VACRIQNKCEHVFGKKVKDEKSQPMIGMTAYWFLGIFPRA